MLAPTWWCYLVRCGGGELYCGATTDPARRLAEHAAGAGARYARGRGPLELAWAERQSGRSAALRREAEVKRMGRAAKLSLIAGVA